MTERERLIELLDSYYQDYGAACSYLTDKECEDIADILLSNGVIVPPCKVGDTVYGLYHPISNITTVVEEKVTRHIIETSDDFYKLSDFGKRVFLTREEAEKALKEREQK